MKLQLITIIAAVLFPPLAAVAMPTDQKEAKEAEAATRHAKAVYARIQAAEPVAKQVIPFQLDDDPMEGTITKYEYEGGLRAITFDYVAGDHGGSTEHYYYEKEVLVFAFVKDQMWQFDAKGPAEQPRTVDTLTERRFYFADGKCLRALERSATSADAEQLPALIAKVENREVDPPQERVARLLATAKGLPVVNRGAMAQDFVESLW